MHSLTEGHLRRHVAGTSATQGIGILDVAQDFALNAIHASGLFEDLVFKGGTALRKMYAGAAGRFSTDLDFGVRSPQFSPGWRGIHADLIADVLRAGAAPFEFVVEDRRGRYLASVESEFGSAEVKMKIDVGPFPWLQPSATAAKSIPIHDRYGFELPEIPVVQLAETMAEKIARLNRTSTARDAWDLVWLASTSPHSAIDRDLVRRMAVLKCEADRLGIAGSVQPDRAKPFDPKEWLRPRTGDWDDETIGTLAPVPVSLAELGEGLANKYSWLAQLTKEDEDLIDSDPSGTIAAIAQLAGCPWEEKDLWAAQP